MPATPNEYSSRAADLIASALVWENHCCMPFSDAELWMPQIERYKAAGFDVVHVNIGDSDVPLDRMVRALAGFRSWLAKRADEYVLVRSVADVFRARQEGKLAVCFDIEGAQALARDTALIPMFYELGVRWLLVAYNRGNLVGAGCHDASDEGLTPFGREFMREMDRVGMIKDVAHTGFRTAMDVCEMSSVPVTISHSNPKALKDHPRCVSDELMKACAATGGVLGISGLSIFMGSEGDIVANFVRSIEYSVETMGIDHVGIGLDYVFRSRHSEKSAVINREIWPDGYGYGTSQFLAPEQIPSVVEALLARGFREADVAKILGGNFLRVAREVWK
ncbi:MAG: membrane dipeptidase [Gammaproteobacteria bacterium]